MRRHNILLEKLVKRACERDKKVGYGDMWDILMTMARIAYRAGFAAGKKARAKS